MPMPKLTVQQANTMLSLQFGMNSKVDPNWLEARYPYLRAVVIEGAEAMEHHGWKWWKHQQLNLGQLRMELIDIWHFLLSEILLQGDGDLEKACDELLDLLESEAPLPLMFDGRTYQPESMDLVSKLELLIGTSVARRIEVGLFEAILRDCQMSWNELFRQYVGKNVLNFFRQDHGYKQGTYRKLWEGREDNEHLLEVLHQLDAQHPDFQQAIYGALSERYQASR